jgi:large subunit ribosomal protein L13
MQLERITNHTKPVNREPSWLIVDAGGERLGRVASRIANVLQGKNKADYSRHQISGDFVIVINAAKVDISGNKGSQKIYYRHTGYVGHLRERTFDEMLARFPGRVIEMAVKGMLPRNRLGRQMFRRLKVYAGAEHPHEAQVNSGLGKAQQKPAAASTRRKASAKPAVTGTDTLPAAGEPEEAKALAFAVQAEQTGTDLSNGSDEEEKV